MTDDELVESVGREWKRDREEARAAAEPVQATSEHDALAARIVEDAARALAAPKVVAPARGWNARRVAAWAAAPIAIAAAIALYVGRAHEPSAALPSYVASWDGDRMERSSGAPADEVLGLSITGNVNIVVRPSTPVVGPVEAHCALVRGNLARAWDPRIDVSSEGAVRIAGTTHQVFNVPAGEWTAVVAVGRPGDVPTDPQAIAAGPPEGDTTWQVFKHRVVFRAAR